MSNIIICEIQLGIVSFDWTMIFQIVNSLLWILIIYAIYNYFKRSKAKQKMLEERVVKLEKEVDNLKDK